MFAALGQNAQDNQIGRKCDLGRQAPKTAPDGASCADFHVGFRWAPKSIFFYAPELHHETMILQGLVRGRLFLHKPGLATRQGSHSKLRNALTGPDALEGAMPHTPKSQKGSHHKCINSDFNYNSSRKN